MEATVMIAILPFDNESRDVSQDYFGRGFVEDLATELSRFPTLEILHPQSSDTGSAYRLSGSVRRIDDVVFAAAGGV